MCCCCNCIFAEQCWWSSPFSWKAPLASGIVCDGCRPLIADLRFYTCHILIKNDTHILFIRSYQIIIICMNYIYIYMSFCPNHIRILSIIPHAPVSSFRWPRLPGWHQRYKALGSACACCWRHRSLPRPWSHRKSTENPWLQREDRRMTTGILESLQCSL